MLTRSAFDGMVDPCCGYRNAGGHSFPYEHITECTHILKINTPKIDKVLKVEINLSVLEFMYFDQIELDLSKLGLNI